MSLRIWCNSLETIQLDRCKISPRSLFVSMTTVWPCSITYSHIRIRRILTLYFASRDSFWSPNSAWSSLEQNSSVSIIFPSCTTSSLYPSFCKGSQHLSPHPTLKSNLDHPQNFAFLRSSTTILSVRSFSEFELSTLFRGRFLVFVSSIHFSLTFPILGHYETSKSFISFALTSFSMPRMWSLWKM